MLLNIRYVDLSEAIDTEDASFLDNTEFTDTDAVPLNTTLPTAHYLVDEVTDPFLRTHTHAYTCTHLYTYIHILLPQLKLWYECLILYSILSLLSLFI